MFSYEKAFSRNIGWLAGHEQEIRRNKAMSLIVGKAKVKSIIRTWISNGAFKVEERADDRRETRKFIVMGKGPQ